MGKVKEAIPKLRLRLPPFKNRRMGNLFAHAVAVHLIVDPAAFLQNADPEQHVGWATGLPMLLLTMRRLGEGSVTYEHAGVIADGRGCAFDR